MNCVEKVVVRSSIEVNSSKKGFTGLWWSMPLIPALGRQRQVDLCEFKSNLVYRVSSRTARAVTQRNPVLKTATKKGFIFNSL